VVQILITGAGGADEVLSSWPVSFEWFYYTNRVLMQN